MGIIVKDKFFRVAAVSPRTCPADVDFNVRMIAEAMKAVDEKNVRVAVFPELCITGYTCGDLFLTETLISAAKKGLEELCALSKSYDCVFIFGYPKNCDGLLYNMSAAVFKGEIVLEVGKRNIPNYGEFYEKRWFSPWQGTPSLLEIGFGEKGSDSVKIGIEICEDLWVPDSPSTELCQSGAEIIFNLSASDDNIGKYGYLRDLIKMQSAKCICGYVYAGAGFGESSTDLVFDGKTIIAENGRLLAANTRWNNDTSIVIADIDTEILSHDRAARGYFGTKNKDIVISRIEAGEPHNSTDEIIMREISSTPFVPSSKDERNERCEEIVNIQAAGLARRLDFTHCKNLIVGVSGGLDSTLALLIACKAFDRLKIDRRGIIAVTMPGFGTTSHTKGNAETLATELGVELKVIPIGPAVEQHFQDIGHDPAVHDVTYENVQARMRTLVLMNLANKYGGMVLGTGDMSEMALGWATYNGDHMSMYNVNGGVPKTLVKYLVEWFATREPKGSKLRETLESIVATPVSPELLPPDEKGSISQVTEDLVGPYLLHDFFLYYFLRYGFGPEKIFIYAREAFKGQFTEETILKWMKIFFRRFFSQQFKRSCMPDGPKVGSVCLSPRGDWRMPSDASSEIWIKELDKLIDAV